MRHLRLKTFSPRRFRVAGIIFFILTQKTAIANDICAAVKVIDSNCKPESVQVDLGKCEDSFVSVRKIKCTSDSISLSVRGKNFNYQLKLKGEKTGWNAEKWAIASQSETERKISAKRKTAAVLPVSIPQALLSPAAPVEPTRIEKKEEPALKFSAYFDAYYQYNFNRPKAATSSGEPQNSLRAYDTYSNQLALNLAELTVKYSRPETSFLMDLDFGSFADANSQTPILAASGGPTPSSSNEVTKHIGQAVFNYSPKNSPWSFDVGKMPTHVGLETMKPKDNWNYSRSALFTFGGPFWHTGAHIGYTLVPERLSAGFYLYNGWNTTNDANSAPTYGAQLKWSPSESLTWIYNYLGGPEQSANTSNWKQVHDTNATYALSSTVSLAADALYGNEAGVISQTYSASWYGAQLGAKFQTSEKTYLSPRVEIYRDPKGYTLGGTDDQSLTTYTLTHGRMISEGFELRFEGRLDHGSATGRFISNHGTSPNQPTLTLGILYSM